MKTISELLTLPKIEEMPDFGLYMDQVITYMQRKYPANPLTKTMINNYTKDKILFPSIKKKYSREHLMLLSIIQILKRTLSLPEIKVILGPISADLEKNDLTSLYELYHGFSNIYDDIIFVADDATTKASALTSDHNLRVLGFALLSAYFGNLSEDNLAQTEEEV